MEFLSPHGEGSSSFCYVPNGSGLVATAGADAVLAIRSDGDLGTVKSSVNTSILNPTVRCLVSAGSVVAIASDTSVKAYNLPGLTSGRLITKSTLPVRSLAIDPSGNKLAVGGDDAGIKLIALASSTVLRVLGSQPYTRGLVFDPENQYLAAITANGSLAVYDVETGKPLLQVRGACPRLDVLGEGCLTPAWHPDGGSVLAVPGREGEVSLYERLSWRLLSTIKTGLTSDLRLLAYSPNGVYLAAADEDSSLAISEEHEKIARRIVPDAISCLSWAPDSNKIAICTAKDGMAIWNDALPAELLAPHVNPDTAPIAPDLAMEGGQTGKDQNARNEEDDDSSTSDDESTHTRKRHKKRRPLRSIPPQQAFQPGSTRFGPNGRRYLCFNTVGTLTLKHENSQDLIETHFHDTSKFTRRVPLISDFLGYSLGQLSEQGILLACPSRDSIPSSVLFKPLVQASPDWTGTLPTGEDVIGLALGASFFCLATSKNLLRIHAHSGLTLVILTMPGPIVAVAAQGDQLAVAYHASLPDQEGNQKLAFQVYDVLNEEQTSTGMISLSPSSSLSWLGFTEEGLLAAQDSAEELRILSRSWGGSSWIPLFSVTAARQNEAESFWLVGCSLKEVTCIIGNDRAQPEPAVPASHSAPRPILSTLPTNPPVVSGLAEEADWFVRRLARKAAEYGEQDDHLSAAQRMEDQASLKLMTALMRSQEQTAACLDLARDLHTIPALDGAVKLATHFRLSSLADSLALQLEARMNGQVPPVQNVRQPRHDDGLNSGTTPATSGKRKAISRDSERKKGPDNPFARRAKGVSL